MRDIFMSGLDNCLDMSQQQNVMFETLEPRLLLSGTSYVVDSLLDVVASDGVVTLREAIEAANTNTAVTEDVLAGSSTASDSIMFDASLSGGVIVLGGTELLIDESLDIMGLGTEVLAVDGDGLSRVFHIDGRETEVSVSGLTVTGGALEDDGGGIYNYYSMLKLEGVVVSGNSTTYRYCDGGGIYNYYGTVILTGSTVSGNSAAGNYGGGVYNLNGSLTLTGSTVSGNSSEYSGGGIHNIGELRLTNSIISCNWTTKDYSYGGGIYIGYDDTLVATNSTVVGNIAGGSNSYCGGIYNSSQGSVTLSNTIVALNSDSHIHGQFSGSNNLIGIDPGFVRDPSAGVDGEWGTADDDYGDLRLADTSVAINRGDETLAVDGGGISLATDMEGNARVAHGQVDIGAYEYQGALSQLVESPSTLVTTLSDIVDSTDGEISLREAMIYAGDTGADVTFAGHLSGGTFNTGGTPLYIDGALAIDAKSVGGLTIDAGGISQVIVIGGDAEVSLSGLTVSGGYVRGNGGGIFNHGELVLTDSTISGNLATGSYNHNGGGGIYNAGALFVVNSMITGNLVSGTESAGGGIMNDYGDVTLTNTTVAGNSTSSSYCYWGGGIFNQHRYKDDGGALTINNSIVAFNDGGNIEGDFNASNSLIGIDPGFVRNPWAGADGEWGTGDDDYGDLRLTDISLAINRGDETLAVDDDGISLTTDMEGNGRVACGQVDIGAYEYQGEVSPLLESPSGVVTTLSDVEDSTDGEISLREAMVYGVILGEDISFASHLSGGTILLNGRHLPICQPMVIDAMSVGGVTIDGGGLSRVMSIGHEGDVILSGLTIRGGYVRGRGGGIMTYGDVTFLNTTVSDNTVMGNGSLGGGIYNQGSLTFLNSAVRGNRSEYIDGGGIYNWYGVVTMTDSVLSDNWADRFGGGMDSYEGEVILRNTTVSGNTGGYGGGVYNSWGKMEVINSTVWGNSGEYGGGIYNRYSGQVRLVNTTVVGNTVEKDGGGIYNNGSKLTVTNSNILNNTAGDEGGGICTTYYTVALNNTIVSFNEALTGDNIHSSSGTFMENSSLVGVDPMFIRNPADGGDGWGDDLLTEGVDESLNDDYGDLRLQVGSPAIDIGNNGYLPGDDYDFDGDGNTKELLPVDINGDHRFSDWRVDAGAYEFAGSVFNPVCDFNADGVVGLLDLDILGRNWGVESGATRHDGDATGEGEIGLLDLDILGRMWGATTPVTTPSAMTLGAGVDPIETDWWEIELEDDAGVVELF